MHASALGAASIAAGWGANALLRITCRRRHALRAWALAGSRILRSPRKPGPRHLASGVMRAVHGAYPAGRLRRSCVAPARTSHWRDLPLADRKHCHALRAWALAGSRILRSPRKSGPRHPASGVRTGAICHWRDLPLADRKRQCSPSADGVDDFDAITFAEQVRGVFRARHDAAIDLDRDTALRVTDVFEQFR
jgi:hypothetical protein